MSEVKQFNIEVEVVSINTNMEPLVTKTVNKTPYYLGTVKFNNKEGKPVERTAQFWTNAVNADGYKMPKHQATVSVVEDGTAFITVIAEWVDTRAAKASVEDFDMVGVGLSI